MSSRPWMPLYVADFRMDTLDLSFGEIGMYLSMLMLAWQREDAAIPNDMAWLKRSLKSCMVLHGHTFNRIVPRLLKRYFQLGADDKWRNKRLTLERQKLDKLSAKQAQNADKRWSETKEINDLVDASAMPSHSHSQSKKESKDGLSGKRKRKGPRHGAISRKYGTVFIHAGTKEWVAYVADWREVHGYQPEPNKDGGYWFNVVGEVPPPPLRRSAKDH